MGPLLYLTDVYAFSHTTICVSLSECWDEAVMKPSKADISYSAFQPSFILIMFNTEKVQIWLYVTQIDYDLKKFNSDNTK